MLLGHCCVLFRFSLDRHADVVLITSSLVMLVSQRLRAAQPEMTFHTVFQTALISVFLCFLFPVMVPQRNTVVQEALKLTRLYITRFGVFYNPHAPDTRLFVLNCKEEDRSAGASKCGISTQ